jgi:hypothetical protein
VLKFSAKQLNRVKHQLEPEVAHFEHTQEGLGIAHLESEPVLFVLRGILLVNGDFLGKIYGIGGVTNGRVGAWQG